MRALNDTIIDLGDENSILVPVPWLVLLVLAVVKKIDGDDDDEDDDDDDDDDDADEVRQRVWQMVMRETGGRHWW